jgi:hypothetical protein
MHGSEKTSVQNVQVPLPRIEGGIYFLTQAEKPTGEKLAFCIFLL